jgi:hypothetical protein
MRGQTTGCSIRGGTASRRGRWMRVCTGWATAWGCRKHAEHDELRRAINPPTVPTTPLRLASANSGSPYFCGA